MSVGSISGSRRPSERLANVQALRGVAALLVAAMHATLRQVNHYGADSEGMREAAHIARSVGNLGVDIFFVISGFIIFTVLTRASRRSNSLAERLRETGRFAWRRVLRIYPLYWLTAAVMIALYGFSPPPSSAPLLRQFLLVTRDTRVHPVAWTLGFEVYFYGVIAACLLALGRKAKLGVAFWIAAEVALIATWTVAPDAASWLAPWQRTLPLDPLVLEFGLGCGVAALVTGRRWLPALTLTAAALVPITLGTWQLYAQSTATGLLPDPLVRLEYFGTGAMLLLIGAVLLEHQDRWVAPLWLQALGDASYSLYLWHLPVIIALGELGRRAPFAWSKGSAIMALLEMAAALLVAFASYRWIERPLLNRVRGSPPENRDSARAA